MAKRRRRGEGSIGLRKDGRWHGRIDVGRSHDGQRGVKHVYAATHRDVLRKMKRIAGKIAEGTCVPATTPSLAHFLEEWFIRNEPQWRAATRRAYRGSIDGYLVPAFGSARLEKITPLMIQRWIDRHRAAHGARRRIAHAHAVLRSALGEAYRLQLVPSNAAAVVKLPKLTARAITPLSIEEAGRFIGEASKHRLGALFTVTLACGLRLGEALGLTWRDIDLDAGVLCVNQQLQQVGKLHQLQQLKTRKSQRKLMLPQFAKVALESHRARQREELFGAGRMIPSSRAWYSRPTRARATAESWARLNTHETSRACSIVFS